MCGIVGVIANQPASPLILDGLRRLEYRGYDSAGIATLHEGAIERQRAVGKLINLEQKLSTQPLPGLIGIGHTRWATHGAPNEANAHPHQTPKVAVVHNGIIENFSVVRSELQAEGYAFLSDTDTEVIPVLITSFLEDGLSPKEAFAAALKRFSGAFAIGAIMLDAPGRIYIARKGAPLVIGHGENEMYMASDAIALASLTQRITYLEDGEWAELTQQGASIFNSIDAPITREPILTSLSGASIGKGNYRHFMLKEIHEQPAVIGETLNFYLNPTTRQVHLPIDAETLRGIEHVTIVACGTSFYAGMVAKYWLEALVGLPVMLDIASEFRYRSPVMRANGMAIFISQSGETADTLAAMRYAKQHGQLTAVVVNVTHSTMAREADLVLPIHAGPEIGVASTKAFTAQLATLMSVAVGFAQAKQSLSDAAQTTLIQGLFELPSRASRMLQDDAQLQELARKLMRAKSALYIGRGISFPVALEGALKLKEISYIHAEGYAAGELKHGPIALVDKRMPVIAIAPHDELFEKTASNIQEVAARGGEIILISHAEGCAALSGIAAHCITLPDTHPLLSPLLAAIPVQLLAYHVAVWKGTDVDQPRNLAKSVTVE
jgi:glucosamine--fructose-6-phosphate aminotransferase (isomerizing)